MYTDKCIEINSIDPNKLKLILDEISKYDVELVPDPTLPEFGSKYIQESLAKCRAYLNRVQYYLQITKSCEKNLRAQLRLSELDLELKLKMKLADDDLVRRQPSIEDRKALASSMLKEEHTSIAHLKVELLDVEETNKIIKMKYDHLKSTSQDIKLQRTLVKDDSLNKWATGMGYEPPERTTVTSPFGVPTPVNPRSISPKDILDPNKRPEDFPVPLDETHANQIAEFYARHSAYMDDSVKEDKVTKTDSSIKALSVVLDD